MKKTLQATYADMMSRRLHPRPYRQHRQTLSWLTHGPRIASAQSIRGALLDSGVVAGPGIADDAKFERAVHIAESRNWKVGRSTYGLLKCPSGVWGCQ